VSTLLFSAAEPSGDLLAGPVIEELRAQRPDLVPAGVTGPAMRAAGARSIGDIADLSGSGLVEVLPRLPAILRVRRRLRDAIVRGRPTVAVLVDAPDLHLTLHRVGRRAGVRTVQLVPPQFWAWRERRGTALRSLDRVLCLFRFEAARLRELGVSATWVGHPVVERAAAARGGERDTVIAVLPGSRRHEQDRHVGPLVAAAKEVGRRRGLRVVLSWPKGRPAPEGVDVSHEDGLCLLARAACALVAPGTATLEAAMVDCPHVVAGALHPLSAAVARRLLRVEHVGLPNLLLGAARVPEVLQDLEVGRLAAALEGTLETDAVGLRRELGEVLGPPGFAARAAGAIGEELDR